MSSRPLQRLTRTTTAAAAVLALSATLTPSAFAQTAPVQFNIAGITDFHGHISKEADKKTGNVVDPGAAELACMLPIAAEGKPQLFVSSGDNIGGSTFNSALLNDEPTLEVLNAMGLAASAVGNHEFDKGYADLAGRVANKAKFPYLGANVEGETPELAPHVIKEINGVKVALVGSVTATTAQKVSPEGIAGITFTDPNKATNVAADKLKASGEADVVVALIHEGFRTPDMFSNSVDIAMAGDSHLIENQVIDRADGSKFALVQANHYGKALADLDITFDAQAKKITDIKSTMHSAEDIDTQCAATPDATIAAIVAAAEAEAKVQGETAVAHTNHSYYRGSNDGQAANSGSNRGVESTISNMLAEAAKQGIGAHTSVKPDLGVMNAGGVRADLLEGDITYKEAFAVQPFGNEITYAPVSGAKIVEALEQQWQAAGSERPMLHLGWSDNLTYTYDPAAEQGKRVTSVTIDGKPIVLTKDYLVAGSTFLLNGGDNFSALKPANGSLPNTGIMDVQLFIDYLKENKDLEPRAGQSNVGVHFASEPTAGESAEVELSSLIYSVNDTATTVSVEIGGKKVQAPIAKTFEAGLPGAGTAKVTVEMPKKGKNPVPMTITTDAGTSVTMPVTVAGLEAPGLSDDSGSSTSSAGSSFGGGLLVAFGLVGVVLAAIQHFNPGLIMNFVNMLPQPVRDALKPVLRF